MRLSIHDLKPSVSVKVSGSEPWLARIYADFPLAPAMLTGELFVELEEAGSVMVTGHIDYQPTLACARCAMDIPWPFAIDLDVRYLPTMLNVAEREVNLSEKDLEAYYLDGDVLDLEALINDHVQTAVPSRAIRTNEDETECLICHADVRAGRLFSSDPAAAAAEPASPFSVLKGLKLNR